MNDEEPEVSALVKLDKDLKEAAKTLTTQQVRYLVDSYYQMQENRKRAGNQVTAMTKAEEPCGVIGWLEDNATFLEKQIKAALDYYSNAQDLGKWARSQVGIGPVITAGLLAHIDLERVTSAGDIWRFAGLDPTSEWKKGEKRPWNASLKVLCWKIGESFVKVCNKPNAYYGQVYLKRKEYEQARNEALAYKAQADAILVKVPNHKQKAVYATGKLPDGHIQSRVKRYAVKLFLAHYMEEGFKLAGKPVPLPYPIARMGHTHVIAVPATT